jgi:hypothetical protein
MRLSPEREHAILARRKMTLEGPDDRTTHEAPVWGDVPFGKFAWAKVHW